MLDGVVYITSLDGKVYALDADTGHERWSFTTEGDPSNNLAMLDGVVYFSSDDKVYALDAETGRERWSFTTGDDVTSGPTVVDGVVYVGTDDHKVYSVTE